MNLTDIIQKAFEIGTIQSTFEMTGFLTLVKDVIQPENILEIGTHAGGMFYALDVISKPGLRISIDIPWEGQEHAYEIANLRGTMTHAKWIVGNAHDESTKQMLNETLNGQKLDLIFIDADHTYEGGQKHFEMYKSFVKEGGYIGFHDTVNGWPCGKYYDTLKPLYPHWDFIDDPSCWYGIGVIQI